MFRNVQVQTNDSPGAEPMASPLWALLGEPAPPTNPIIPQRHIARRKRVRLREFEHGPIVLQGVTQPAHWT